MKARFKGDADDKAALAEAEAEAEAERSCRGWASVEPTTVARRVGHQARQQFPEKPFRGGTTVYWPRTVPGFGTWDYATPRALLRKHARIKKNGRVEAGGAYFVSAHDRTDAAVALARPEPGLPSENRRLGSPTARRKLPATPI
jgi:hypothetical protein